MSFAVSAKPGSEIFLRGQLGVPMIFVYGYNKRDAVSRDVFCRINN